MKRAVDIILLALTLLMVSALLTYVLWLMGWLK